MVALLGRKVGMTQVYDEAGVLHPVTVIEVGPCSVMQVRTKDKDGYDALQLGYDDKPRKRCNKAERGHASKAGLEPKRFVREVRLDAPAELQPGATLTAEVFNEIKRVDVIGTMKGRGFSGTVKRHGFHGLESSHGVLRKHRSPGSIGTSAFPSRVIRGRRMSGQYGACRSTVRNIRVVRVDVATNSLLIQGSVPGPNGGYVVVRQTNKKKRPASEGGSKK